MKITIRHYFDFREQGAQIGQSLNTPSGWDILHIGGEDNTPFFIPSDRLSWERKCLENKILKWQAEDICRVIKRAGFRQVNSFGVGGGFLEYWIKKNIPDILLRCSDYTPQSIHRLQKVFIEADEIIHFDMLKDAWSNDGSDCLYLFYRIDTAIDNQQWKEIFRQLYELAVENILFVPSNFLTLRLFLKQKGKLWLYRCLGKRIAWAGYLRTKEQIEDLFTSYYEIRKIEGIGSLRGYLLGLKNVS